MALISDALRQAFMPKQQYETLSEESRAWTRLKKPLLLSVALLLFLSILIPAVISLRIVFPSEPSERPFCRARRRLEEALPVNSTGLPELYRIQGGTFYITDDEAADFYWLVVFLPSAIVFFASIFYLVAGWYSVVLPLLGLGFCKGQTWYLVPATALVRGHLSVLLLVLDWITAVNSSVFVVGKTPYIQGLRLLTARTGF